MSHEIRTPMNGVIGMTELLQETELTENQLDYVRTISSSGESLLTVINDILDFSKIEAGQLSIESTDFSVAQVLWETLRFHSQAARQKGIELKNELAASTECVCMGDPVRIRQVVSNLLSNAIKFTTEGSVVLHAAVIEHKSGPRLVISVEDTGDGIPADRVDAIFQSFTQADATTTRRFGGTGLGLTICRQLVTLMGGKIWVESEVGKGSQFHAEIQLGSQESGAASPSRKPAPADLVSAKAMFTGLRVLLVEDNLVNQRVAARMLEGMGCVITTVPDGSIAVERLSEGFDLIFMDCHMPVMDGFEATHAIRKLEEATGTHTPIVAMTASAMEEDRRKCLDAGMDDFVVKPVRQQVLAGVIGKFRQPEAA